MSRGRRTKGRPVGTREQDTTRKGAPSEAAEPTVSPSPPGHADETRAGANGVPCLGDGVELIGRFEGSGYKKTPYLARRADGQVIQLTELLHLIASKVDGRRDDAAIARAVTDEFGRGVSSDNVAFLVDRKLRPLGVVAAKDGSTQKIRKPDPLLALRFKTVLVPERAVNVVTLLFKPLFWPPVILAVLAAFVALDVWYFGVHGVAPGVRSALYEPATILVVYALLVLSVGWHEVGHATACRYGGARPGVIGFGIYVVWPAFYTDVTDVYRLGKAGRIRTDLGGVYFNAIFALATTGLYLVTRFEPLLTIVLMQHLLIFYQFMPFLRLDGYYVVSDLTGVPDLFARIKPIMRSLLPWKKTGDAVTALKPWVRVVVTLWVLTVLPVLLYGLTMMVVTAPRVLATSWDSLLVQGDKIQSALDAGSPAALTVGSLQAGLIVLPLGGMGMTLGRVLKRVVSGTLRATRAKPAGRVLAVLAFAAVAAGIGWILLPNGEYRPLQAGERGTISDSLEAVRELRTGRPGLTEVRARELDGAPFISGRGGAPETTEAPPVQQHDAQGGAGPAQGGTGQAEPETDPDDPDAFVEESPSPTPTEDDVEASPTPEVSETPTPEPTTTPEE